MENRDFDKMCKNHENIIHKPTYYSKLKELFNLYIGWIL